MILEEEAFIRRRPAGCLSDLTLERLHHGELPGPSGERARAHCESCPDCGARWAALPLASAPPPFAPLLRRLDAPVAASGRGSRWPAALAALATLGLVFWLRPSVGPEERLKGGPWELGVLTQVNGRTTRLASGATVHPGDRLQFELRVPASGYAAIIDLDSRGVATPFYPISGRAVAVSAGVRHRSTNAVLLDEALGPETLILLACREPLAISEIVRVARERLAQVGKDPRQVGRLPLPCDQQPFWLAKVAAKGIQ